MPEPTPADPHGPEPTPTAAPGSQPTTPPSPQGRSVGELVFDVSERTSSLIREEIELAKTEVSEKVGKILRGSVVGIAAGTFAFLALILVMEGFAWLLNEEVFDGKSWPGFFIEAALFLLIAAGAGLFAYRSVQAGAPPMPEQAIEEAKLTKAVFEGEESKPVSNVSSGPVSKVGDK
ncbi:MAG TPA: phage holin family protein [Solirubrobacterales bacterium]|jgi:hypothetical protein